MHITTRQISVKLMLCPSQSNAEAPSQTSNSEKNGKSHTNAAKVATIKWKLDHQTSEFKYLTERMITTTTNPNVSFTYQGLGKSRCRNLTFANISACKAIELRE